MTTRKSPVPRPGPTDVVVRVEAVAVDPVDLFVGSGRYDPPLPFPFVVGGDVVGTVTACGPGVAGLSPGERVWSNSLGPAGRQGPSVELAVVPVDRLHHLPDPVDPPAAVAVLHRRPPRSSPSSPTESSGRARRCWSPAAPAMWVGLRS